MITTASEIQPKSAFTSLVSSNLEASLRNYVNRNVAQPGLPLLNTHPTAKTSQLAHYPNGPKYHPCDQNVPSVTSNDCHEGKKQFECTCYNQKFSQDSHRKNHQSSCRGFKGGSMITTASEIQPKSAFTSLVSSNLEASLRNYVNRNVAQPGLPLLNTHPTAKTSQLAHYPNGPKYHPCDQNVPSVTSNDCHEGKKQFECTCCNQKFSQDSHRKNHQLSCRGFKGGSMITTASEIQPKSAFASLVLKWSML